MHRHDRHLPSLRNPQRLLLDLLLTVCRERSLGGFPGGGGHLGPETGRKVGGEGEGGGGGRWSGELSVGEVWEGRIGRWRLGVLHVRGVELLLLRRRRRRRRRLLHLWWGLSSILLMLVRRRRYLLLRDAGNAANERGMLLRIEALLLAGRRMLGEVRMTLRRRDVRDALRRSLAERGLRRVLLSRLTLVRRVVASLRLVERLRRRLRLRVRRHPLMLRLSTVLNLLERSSRDGSRWRLTVRRLLLRWRWLLLLLSESALLLTLKLFDVELNSLSTAVTANEGLAFVDDGNLAVPADEKGEKTMRRERGKRKRTNLASRN